MFWVLRDLIYNRVCMIEWLIVHIWLYLTSYECFFGKDLHKADRDAKYFSKNAQAVPQNVLRKVPQNENSLYRLCLMFDN